MLFCTGCQANHDESEFLEAPKPRGNRKYLWDCIASQAAGTDKTERQLADLAERFEDSCLTCGIPTIVDPEGICRRCQAEMGFRFCGLCKRKKLVDLDFYSGRSECVDCSGSRRRQDYVQCSTCGLWNKKGTTCSRPSCKVKLCKHCKKQNDQSPSRICKLCREARHNPLKCRWCKRIEPEVQFFSTRVCEDCNKKPTDELRNGAKLSLALKKYGLTLADYQHLLREQDGACKICRKTTERRLAVDHDHATGKIRGLLCVNCNLGLGNFKDSIESLNKAIQYLTQASPR